MEVRRINNEELYHHGVKGQRWGIRRYQNADGSLTNAGRERYLGNIDKSQIDYTEYDQAYKNYKNIIDQCVDKHDSTQTKRLEDAADTALRALDRNDDYGIGYEKYYRDESEDVKKSARDWLIWEDQTIGYVEIADLANQGKSVKQIHKILEDAENTHKALTDSGERIVNKVKDTYLPVESRNTLFDYDTNDYIEKKVLKAIDDSEIMFDLDEFYYNTKGDDYFSAKHQAFIDNCVKEASIKRKSK